MSALKGVTITQLARMICGDDSDYFPLDQWEMTKILS